MSFAYLVSLLLLGSIAFALVREMRKASPRPAGLRGHIRARGWGLLLLPIALMAAVMTGHVHALAVAELAVAGALVTWAPRLAAKLVPYALLALALFGLILAKAYHDGFSSQVLYGLVIVALLYLLTAGSWVLIIAALVKTSRAGQQLAGLLIAMSVAILAGLAVAAANIAGGWALVGLGVILVLSDVFALDIARRVWRREEVLARI